MHEINKKKLTITGLFLLLVVIAFIPIILIYLVLVEDYCMNKAKETTGDKWSVMLGPTEEEKTAYGAVKVSLAFREQRSCERKMSLYLF